MSTAEHQPTVHLVLEAGRADRQYWRDLWRYRELFFILAWRDVAVRYKQTVIGLAWAFLRPFLTMVVFTLVFGHLARLPSSGSVPYAVMVFAGLLPWTLFSSVLSEASSSVMTNAHLVTYAVEASLVIWAFLTDARLSARVAFAPRPSDIQPYREQVRRWLAAVNRA